MRNVQELRFTLSSIKGTVSQDATDILQDAIEELINIRRKYEAQTDIIAQMERELNWYRQHDLVERERARLMCQFFYDEELRNLLTESIASLPKAEPPCVNSNEIKRELNEKSNERNDKWLKQMIDEEMVE